MRRQNLAIFVCLIGCAQAWAATPIVSQPFPAYSSTNWQLNGTVSEGVYGLGSGVSGTGSLIYKHSLPNEYEVRTRYSINATGGSFVTYFRATQDAQLTLVGGVATPGTFYALELNDPQGSNGNYSCVLALWKNQNNEITLKGATTIACYNNIVLRVAVRNTFILVFRDEPLRYLLFTSDMSIASGSGQSAFLSSTGM
jgi:hypothetical protein